MDAWGLSVKQAFGFDPTLVGATVCQTGRGLVSVLTAGTMGLVSELRGHWPSTDVLEASVLTGVGPWSQAGVQLSPSHQSSV